MKVKNKSCYGVYNKDGYLVTKIVKKTEGSSDVSLAEFKEVTADEFINNLVWSGGSVSRSGLTFTTTADGTTYFKTKKQGNNTYALFGGTWSDVGFVLIDEIIICNDVEGASSISDLLSKTDWSIKIQQYCSVGDRNIHVYVNGELKQTLTYSGMSDKLVRILTSRSGNTYTTNVALHTGSSITQAPGWAWIGNYDYYTVSASKKYRPIICARMVCNGYSYGNRTKLTFQWPYLNTAYSQLDY